MIFFQKTISFIKNIKIKYLIVILVLLFLLISIAITSQYFSNRKISQGIQGVYVTDVTDSSAVVSWVTSQPVKTELIYSKEGIGFLTQFIKDNIGYDRRDLEETGELEYILNRRGEYFVHSVVLRNLTPNTEYNFEIRNGLFFSSATYINSFTTINTVSSMQTPQVAYGNIYNQNGDIISDTLLLLYLSNKDDTYRSQEISYVMSGQEGWSVDISNLLDESLENVYTKENETYLNIEIINSKERVKKTVDSDFIKPVVNISMYDNEYVFSNGSDVKGVAVCNDGDLKTTDGCRYICAGGEWEISYCPEDSDKSCPVGGGSYETDTEKCIGVCDTTQGVWGNFKCTPKKETAVCAEGDSREEIKSNGSKCGYTCMYNEWMATGCTPPVQEDPKEVAPGTQAECKASGMYWCTCVAVPGATPACVDGQELKNEYSSSCSEYCKQSLTQNQEGFTKTEICGQGSLANCQYGCEDRGEEENDICKPQGTVSQELLCGQISEKDDCLGTDGCTYEDGSCKSSQGIQNYGCGEYKYASACHLAYGCEFTDLGCVQKGVDFVGNGDFDTSGYVNLNPGSSDICTGMPLSPGGDTANVTQGTNMTNVDYNTYHINKSSCAVDLGVSKGTPLWNDQIPGYSINDEKKVEWEDGYECKSVEGSEQGYGCYIDVTMPTGETVRYAHLTCTDNFDNSGCNSGIKSGDSGNGEAHLHVEVLANSVEETGDCQEEMNPCYYIPGGCYDCSSDLAGVPIPDEPITSIKGIDSSTQLISKVFGQEEWPDARQFVTSKDLEQGVYTVTVGTSARTRNFIKTDDNEIVFFADENNNGMLDLDESILSPYELEYKYNISYSKIADVYKLVLQEGLNLVSFPVSFTNEEGDEIRRASELLPYLNSQGATITTIATYRDGIFLTYVDRAEEQYGEDFNILPGEAYFVISLSQGVFLYSGNMVENSLEIYLRTGWNLVNIYNSLKPSYTGFNLLQQMKNASLEATTLSKWEDGRYTSIVDSDGNQYGYDFNVYPTRGYFIKIENGEGKFSPE